MCDSFSKINGSNVQAYGLRFGFAPYQPDFPENSGCLFNKYRKKFIGKNYLQLIWILTRSVLDKIDLVFQ